jgi:hypothetical protein
VDYDAILKSDDFCNLKALLGGMFADYLHEYTHWGWVDDDLVVGDMSKMIEDLRRYHIATYLDEVSFIRLLRMTQQIIAL